MFGRVFDLLIPPPFQDREILGLSNAIATDAAKAQQTEQGRELLASKLSKLKHSAVGAKSLEQFSNQLYAS